MEQKDEVSTIVGIIIRSDNYHSLELCIKNLDLSSKKKNGENILDQKEMILFKNDFPWLYSIVEKKFDRDIAKKITEAIEAIETINIFYIKKNLYYSTLPTIPE